MYYIESKTYDVELKVIFFIILGVQDISMSFYKKFLQNIYSLIYYR